MDNPQLDPKQSPISTYCSYLTSDSNDPLNLAPDVRWYRRTPTGLMFGKFVAVTGPFYLTFAFFVLMAISGQLSSYIMPEFYNMGVTVCNNNLFTLNATSSDWWCNGIRGMTAWSFLAFIALYVSLMFSPLYWWLRLNKNYKVMWGLVIGLLPFYVFGLELFGVMATKIINNYDLIESCNLDSYLEFMNLSCLKYGAITEAIILGIELGIAMMIAGWLTLKEYWTHNNHDLVETHIEETTSPPNVVELDPQMTAGN